MPTKGPDFATLASEEAYDAADRALIHIRLCDKCDEDGFCSWGKSLMGNYRGLKKKALQMIRGAQRPKAPKGRRVQKPSLATDNDSFMRRGK